MSFKKQSVNTGIKQLWADAEFCNKWQYQLPKMLASRIHADRSNSNPVLRNVLQRLASTSPLSLEAVFRFSENAVC